MATQVARECGALTLAIVNDENSPAAKAADLVLPISAGLEKAVAATKTVALSMIAGTALVAALSRDAELEAALRRLPRRLADALSCDWSDWSNSLTRRARGFRRRPRLRVRHGTRGCAQTHGDTAASRARLQRRRAATWTARGDLAGNAGAAAAAERRGGDRGR